MIINALPALTKVLNYISVFPVKKVVHYVVNINALNVQHLSYSIVIKYVLNVNAKTVVIVNRIVKISCLSITIIVIVNV